MGEYKRLALLVFVIIGALLIVGASAGHAAQAETKEVVAAVAHDFYPEYVVDADGRPGGFAIDMMNAVAKRAGLSVTYRVFETWSDLIAALERGDADLVPVVSVTRAREGRMLFTRPVVTSPASLFVRQDTDDIRGWSRSRRPQGGRDRRRRLSGNPQRTQPERTSRAVRASTRTRCSTCCRARSTPSSPSRVRCGRWVRGRASPTGSRSWENP